MKLVSSYPLTCIPNKVVILIEAGETPASTLLDTINEIMSYFND